MESETGIEVLVRAFEEGTLPRAAWSHREHLVVALWYLHRHPRDEATRLIRDGIRRYNERQGNPTGYHETITLAWVGVIGRFLEEQGKGVVLPVLAARLLERCGAAGYLLRHYSRAVLLSDEARHRWVPPDLEPIE